MKKFLSVALLVVTVVAFSVSAIAVDGLSLVKEKNVWYIEAPLGFTGTVYFKDNHNTYSKYLDGTQTRYEVGPQSEFTGQLSFVDEDEPDAPTIIGTRTITRATFEGYVASVTFLANQKYQQGPKANYVTAVITETYKVEVLVYDVWSNGDETLNPNKSFTYTFTVDIEGTSNALPNGSESNLVPTFEDGLDGYSIVVSYKGNGSKFEWSILNAPERETVEAIGEIIPN